MAAVTSVDETQPGEAFAPRHICRRATLAWGTAIAAGHLLRPPGLSHLVETPDMPVEAQSFGGDAPSLIIGGVEDGPLDPFAAMIAGAVARLLPAARPMRVMHVGGADGVTAANQFEARTPPDGSTALLVSGAPALAWLFGDPRAQFDAGHWLPVATGLSSACVLRRPGQQGGALRVATSAPADRMVAASLGLSLIGLETAERVTPDQPLAIFLSGKADAIFLRGPSAVQDTRSAQAAGASALFTLGATNETGVLQRDPLLADIPTLPELLARRSPNTQPQALLTAWRATAAASQIEVALLLPWLTPPGSVAWWRKLGASIAGSTPADHENSTIDPAIPAGELLRHASLTSNLGLSAIATDGPTSLALRRWLADHPH